MSGISWIIGSFLFIAYTYFGYPLLLWCWTTYKTSSLLDDPSFIPSVTVVIAAFNEETCIAETTASILAADYPPEKLNIVVVSDASTDNTENIVSSFPPDRVHLLRQETRRGQTAGLLRGVQGASGDIIIIADASGRFLFNTVRLLVRHFADPRVGAVSGYKKVEETGTAVAKGDGAYTRYDRWLRALESQTGSSWVGCQGGLFAIRKPLFRIQFPLDMAADNAIGYELYEQRMLHRFDPEAMVIEKPPQDLENEFRRKIRVIVLQMHGMFYFRRLFIPWRHALFVFQNASHKLFRWLVPFALLVMAAACFKSTRPGAHVLLGLQSFFYALATIGILWGKKRKAPWFLSIPAYFLTVNLAGLLAWGMLFKNYTLWKPPDRDVSRGFSSQARSGSGRPAHAVQKKTT
jgi:cellulose synthase/poly-beta-1,6-N-acetylglucosamine synthase-like glycosyltransferase